MAVGPFALVARAQNAPGHCLRCPRNENLIQLSGDEIRGFGIVYLCAVCFAELADGMKYISKASHERALSGVLIELGRIQDKYNAKEEQLTGALTDVRLFRERISNGVRDLVDRGITDLLAADDERADRGGMVAAEMAAGSQFDGAGDAEPPVLDGAGEPEGAVRTAADGGPSLLAGVLGLRARADGDDAAAAADAGNRGDQAGDVWNFISEPDPE